MTTSSTPDAPRENTLATEVFDDSAATPATTPTATVTAPAPALPEPVYLSGPAPFAVVLGILGLLFAALTLFIQVTDANLPWTDLGPWTVVAAGLVVVLVGAIGLRGSRSRD
jgi:hypothetical protein